MKPTRIVVHNTANDASAANEIAYMIRNNNEVSFHYAVDDKEIVQGIEENRNSWNAGDGGKGKGNREGISIEICYSKTGGEKFRKAEENAVELIVDILKRYKWGIDKVTKHQDYNGKYCPHRTLDLGWDRFIKMIEEKLNEKKEVVKTSIKKGDLVSIKKGAKYYNGKAIPKWVLNNKWYVASISGDRAIIDKSEDGKSAICSPINASYLTVAKRVSANTSKKKGDAIILNNEPLYANATTTKVAKKLTGTYYIYDGKKIDGRYRITNSRARVGKAPIWLYVTGYVDI
jgi:N-acetylmuramoyl-L-alanine amidase CwlA